VRRNAYRDGHVYVCRELCSTCVFRPGNLMRLRSGRVRQMVDEAKADDSAIICHKTLDGDSAVCRGFFDRYSTIPLRLAQAFDVLEEVDPP
jgi:hypothetical protein